MRRRSDLPREPAVPAIIDVVDTAARTALVKVPSWDGGAQRQGPAPYIAQPEPHPALAADVVTHPKPGTECVLVEDSEGGLWIASWRYR